MTLLSPIKVDIRKKGGPFQGAFEVTRPATYTFTENGINITKTMEVFYKSIPINQYQAQVPNVEPISDTSIESYHFLQNSINYCINNAELLNIQLRELLLLIRATDKNKDELYAKDFMSLRDIFSKYLNEDKQIRSEEAFNSKQKRKEITSIMHQYITDRNIYTHGKLRLLMPDEKFFIDYVLEKRELARVQISKEIVQSFLNASIDIKSVISFIHSFVQKQSTAN